MTESMQAEWIRYIESPEGQYALKTWDGDTRNQCWAFHLWMQSKATAGPTDVWQQVQIDAAKWRAQELSKELGWDQPEAQA